MFIGTCQIQQYLAFRKLSCQVLGRIKEYHQLSVKTIKVFPFPTMYL